MFLRTLVEACGQTGWIIHSYVLLPNHYHWLLETPEPNLSAGMHWFQGTYAQRFSKRHQLVGHVFQGRYKAPLIDAGTNHYFRTVSEYIHLNPARAGLLDSACPRLSDYRWSSFAWFIGPSSGLPSWLEHRTVAAVYGLDLTSVRGRQAFRDHLEARAWECISGRLGDVDRQRWAILRRGWCYGSEAFRAELLERVGRALAGKDRASFGGSMLRAHDEQQARRLIDRALRRVGLGLQELRKLRKNDARKQAVAWLVRTRTTMKHKWVGAELSMGSRVSVYQAVRRFGAASEPEVARLKRLLQDLTI